MTQPKIFVGSSREATDKEYDKRLARRLKDDFEIVLWTESFKPMIHHLENIHQLASGCNGALFLFCADDQTLRRDKVEMVTRDNVVFESGYFMGVCGKERVLIIVEKRDDGAETVAVPSDMQGLTYLWLETNRRGIPTEETFDRLAEKVRTFFVRCGEADDDDMAARQAESRYGFSETFAQGEVWIQEQRDALTRRARGRGGSADPIRIESPTLCMTTYTEALARVESSFRTTSLLSSGFWNTPSVQVVAANRRMMDRLKNRDGAVAQRLFLLDVSLERIRDRWTDLAVSRRINEGEIGLHDLRNELRYLRSNIEELNGMGFATRIIDANNEHYTIQLPKELEFQPECCELAIYDDFRFDIFLSKRMGLITEVRCYTPELASFSTYLDLVSRYYEALWADARPIESLLDVLEEAVEQVDERIDYKRNWLIFYDADLVETDRRLKLRELDRVRRQLQQSGRWGKIRRLLDIGTCTGRYVLALREAVRPDGEILGIDNDLDCFLFADKKVREYRSSAGSAPGPKLEILHVDFQDPAALPFDGTFDLVSCMLGTLSHFGYKRRRDPPFDDRLQEAIERMVGLLEPQGVLLLGTWTPYAVEHRNMLTIYRPEDLRRLAQWTPTPEELRTRLDQAKLDYKVDSVEQRLSLYHCTHATAPSTQA